MAVNASRVRRVYDGHSSVVFRAPGSASVVADGYSTALSLNELDAAYWQSPTPELPYNHIVIGVQIEAINLNAGAAIPLALHADDTNNMSDTPVEVGRFAATAVGYYEMLVSAKDLPKIDSESSGLDKWLAVFIDVGAGQTISYHAWIAGHKR